MNLAADRPSTQAIHEALGRVLASEAFSRSDRARKLLDHLVRAEIDGKGDRLKGFSIAMDVFGKDGDFDPATDAVVRVQAGRLRELLEHYYAGTGRNDPVRIIVPRGTYVPTYTAGAGENAAGADGGDKVELDLNRIKAAIDDRFGGVPAEYAGDAPNARRSDEQTSLVGSIVRHIKLFRVGLVAILAMLAFVAWRVATNESALNPGAEQTSSIRGARGAATADMLPRIRLEAADGAATAQLAHQLRAALPAFDSINYVNASAFAAQRGDDFTVRVALGVAEGTALVQVEHAASGKVLVTGAMMAKLDAEGADDALARLLDQAFTTSGAVYAFIAENGLTSSLTECLTLENRFFLDLKAEDHLAAFSCFNELAGRGAKSPLVWAELANLEVAAVTGKFGHHPEASLEKAKKLARKGVELGPNKATAYRAQGYVLGRAGETAAGLDWMRKATEANPWDMSLAASAGNMFVMAGQHDRGVAFLERAARVAPVHPHWWDYALFLGAFAAGADETAWRAADALTGSSRRHYLAARMVAAAARGDAANAGALAGELKAKHAEFLADPAKAFRQAQYPEDLAKKLSDAIKAAATAAGST